MSILSQLNSPPIYAICGAVVAFVAAICIIFMVRAWRAGVALGMDKTKMRRVITASVTFSALPSVGILLGVIALSGSLGTPWPWVRLSVVGALHYETQVAQTAAEAIGMSALSAAEMTPRAFTTIALLMSVCIVDGMVLSILFNKRYLKRLGGGGKSGGGAGGSLAGFGDKAMTAMFIGLICAYLGSYIGTFISGDRFPFNGDWSPLLVAGVSALTMAGCVYLSEKKGMAWLESFSIAGSMLIGMAAAVLLRPLV